MINFDIDLLKYVFIAMISGVINLIVAFIQLLEDCRFLPFFEPHKTSGVWIWVIAQLLFPCWLFWITFGLSSKPNINDFDLVLKSIAFGLGFVALMNAKTETGFFTLDIKTIYSRLVRIAYDLIASKETARTAAFWIDLEYHLNDIPDLSQGISYLASYFLRDVSLSLEQRKERQSRMLEIMNSQEKKEQVKQILSLMDVRRNDLPQVVYRFKPNHNSNEVIKKYFLKVDLNRLS